HNAAARVRCRTAEIQALDGSAVLGARGHGTHKKQLVEREFALKDIPFRQAELALEIQWRQHLAADDQVLKIGSILSNGTDDVIAEIFPLLVPGAFLQVVRRILDEAGHHMLAGWCQ